MNGVVHRAARWAEGRPDVRSVIVVGSYAYNRPRMGSDLDLVILSNQADQHLADLSFIDSITPGGRIIRCEQWGPMHERRVRLRNGLLVEFGVTTPAWAALPIDAGTARVLSDGCKIVTDDGSIAGALASMGHEVEDWRTVT